MVVITRPRSGSTKNKTDYISNKVAPRQVWIAHTHTYTHIFDIQQALIFIILSLIKWIFTCTSVQQQAHCSY